jgi:hypothetical protein
MRTGIRNNHLHTLNSGPVLDLLYRLVRVHRLRPPSVSPAYRRRFLRGLAQFYPLALGSLRSFSVSSGSVLISFPWLRHVRVRGSQEALRAWNGGI